MKKKLKYVKSMKVNARMITKKKKNGGKDEQNSDDDTAGGDGRG